MSDKHCWYGYLEAGSKSSPVLTDASLDSGNPKTQFIFNLLRGEILEYSREIVSPKLRELKPDQTAVIEELNAAYQKVRPGFRGRIGRGFDTGPRAAASRKTSDEEEADLEPDEIGWEEAEA